MNTTILKTSLQLEMVFPNLELEIKTGKVKKKKHFVITKADSSMR